MRTPAPAIPDIVEEHLEEFAFLSLQRRRLIVDWETDESELAAHDERIEAHRDALRVAGAAAVETARLRLEDPAAGWDTYACARVLIEHGELSVEELRERLAGAEDFQRDGWREAFRRSSPDHLRRLLAPAVTGDAEPALHELAVDSAAWLGTLAEPEALAALEHESPAVRGAAARGLGWARFASRDPATVLAGKTGDPDPRVARTVLWALATRDPDAALSLARSAIAGADPDPFALRVTGLLGGESDLAAVARQAARPEAALALGDLGDVRGLDVLVQLLSSADGELVLAAAQGISRIAGFVEGSSDPPTQDTLDPEASRALALAARESLAVEGRWLRGRPFLPETTAGDEPPTTEALWLGAVRTGAAPRDARAREVPDGFWTGRPGDEAECGV